MEVLPAEVIYNILARLDVPSLCSAASSCRHLFLSVSQTMPLLGKFHLVDFAPKHHELERLLCHNSQLQSLKLDCGRLDDEALHMILNPNLEEVHLLNCHHFSSRLLTEIGRRCPGLRTLSLQLGYLDDERGSGIHSIGLEALLQACSSLESLSLTGQDYCLDSHSYAAIPQIVSPTLTVLSLGYVAERNAKELLSLSVDNIETQLLKQDAFRLRSLQKLSLVLDRITDNFVLVMCKNLPCLTDLELQDEPAEEPLLAIDLTTTGIQQIGACLNLRRLILVRSQAMYPATFKRVGDLGFLFLAEKCLMLESIRLGGFSRISDASCRHILHNFPNLHTFEVLRCPRVTDLTFRDFSAISMKLVSVMLTSCNLLSNRSVMKLSYCRCLETLNLKGCRSVGDKGLQAIALLDKLKVLNLSGIDVSDAGLTMLGKGRTPLKFLSLRSCQKVSDNGVAALVEGPISQTLEGVDLSNILALTDQAVLNLIHSGMRIVDLRLRNCYQIGHMSVIALVSMAYRGCDFGGSLRLLDMWNCRGLTARSIGWFKKPYFPRLRRLGLGWNSLSKSALDLLREERPYVQILDHGCELDGCEADETHGCGRPCYEREDELERWLSDE